ncbi:hypothetical protein FSP39_010240 [Pinctada imbricata]|uniref:Uncharacterized protein n=1 Tax=Pinctada imbricata TaxID=66713 RepID=A0AA88YNM3_PINIB|nr:hypothetical protein FSP39_010240 [Pinctada imbricata]
MAEDFSVLRDLQSHLRNAQVPIEQLSTLAKQGDDKLVEQFLTENIRIDGSGPDVLNSQLYIACFWGMKDVVMQLLRKGVGANCQNKGTLWTPLHAAAFQEHGPIVMILLDHGANPEVPDAEGRTPKDFASASDKIWPHFAALGMERTHRWELVDKGVIRKFCCSDPILFSLLTQAASSRPESAYAYNSDPFIHAAVTGDVLADEEDNTPSSNQPQFSMWR